MNDLTVGIVGAVAGSVTTLAWDAFLKPRLDARGLAELILNDFSLHGRVVAQELAKYEEHPRTVPLPQPFPLDLYTAVADRFGELPDAALLHVLHTYRVLSSLNTYSEQANSAYAALDRTKGAADVDATQLAKHVATYKLRLGEAKEFINYALPELLKAARPFWAPRTWFSRGPRVLDAQQVRQEIEATRSKYAEEMDRLVRSGS